MALDIVRIQDRVKLSEKTIKEVLAEYVMQQTGRSVAEVELHVATSQEDPRGDKAIRHATVFLTFKD